MRECILFGMLITILNKGKVTVNELSLKYEISRRTALRYIDYLSMAQIPLISHKGRKGGISIAENFTLDRVFFTKEELERLSTCVGGMAGMVDDSISRDIKDKIACMSLREDRQVLATDTVLIDAGPWGDIKSYKDKFAALEKAISGRFEAEITYHDINGNESKRTVQPYTLVFKKGLWYVYAFCTLRQEFRLFKIGRIAQISVNAKTFLRHDIDIKALPYNIKWFDNNENVNAVFKVSPKIKSDIEEWLSFENIKENADGSIYAFAKLPESGLIQQILSYGVNIEVIEPAELRREIADTVKGIEKLYNGG